MVFAWFLILVFSITVAPLAGASKVVFGKILKNLKGFLMFDIMQEISGIEVFGVDISEYAKANAKQEVSDQIIISNASNLPFEDKYFDLVISINTLHNLKCYDLDKALREITRVSKGNSYICVESYKTEQQKENLLYCFV